MARNRFVFLIPVLLLAFFNACGGAGYKGERLSEKEVGLHLDVAESLLMKNEPRDALRELNQIAPSADKTPRWNFDVGLVHMRMRNYAESEKSFRKTVELDPLYGEAWNNLGHVLFARKRMKEAEDAYKKAVSIDIYTTPEYPLMGLAVIKSRQGNFTEAEKYARMAIDKNWRYIPGYVFLYHSYKDRGRMDEAVGWLKKGVEADLGDMDLLLLYSENLMKQGKNKEAKMWLERIVERSPNTPQAKAAADYLEMMK